MEPNRENIQKWVDALRSGEYAQSRECLHDKDGFCCLGVACDISGLGEWALTPYGHREYLVDDSDEGFWLPREVRAWLGIDSANPLLIEENGESQPAGILNDEEGADFEQIADAIERTYLTEVAA